MPFEPKTIAISLQDKKEVFIEHKKVESKTEILTEEIAKVLNVSAFSYISSTDVKEKNANYVGKTVFYICYQNTSGEIIKKETCVDFEGDYQLNKENCSVNVFSSVEKAEGDISGIKLSLVAVIKIVLRAKSCRYLAPVCGGDNLVCDLKETTVRKSFGEKKGLYPIEEEFEINSTLSEVLYQEAKPCITAVQCGVGSVIIDGEVKVYAILLQNKEKQDIIRESRVIPYRAEIECEDATPSLSVVASVKEKSFKTDISVDQDKNQSTVSLNVVLDFTVEAFLDESTEIAGDLFSLTEEVEKQVEEDTESVYKDMVFCNADYNLKLDAGVNKDCALKAVGGERAEIISAVNENGKSTFTGTLSFFAYFEDREVSFFTKKFEAPFEVSCESLTDLTDAEIYVVADILSANFSGGTLDVKSEFLFSVTPMEKRKIKYIKSLDVVGEKKVNDSAFSVYIPVEGESLWELCKRLNQSPEDLIATNKDLQFPLTGKERIVIYRQK